MRITASILMMICVRLSAADADFSLSNYFVYEISDTPLIEKGVVKLYLDGKYYSQPSLPASVVSEISKCKDEDGFIFKLFELPPVSPYGDREIEVLTIRRGEKVLFDASICPVHHVRMKLERVKVAYGLQAGRGREYYESHNEKFPFSDMICGGGCVVSDDSRKFSYIFVCADCLKAREVYLKSLNHPPEPKPVATH